MKSTVVKWQVAGYLFTSVLGTFFHFLFDLTGGSPIAGLISAVNESIWEHMKLIFYPMLLFAAAEYRSWGRETAGFWCIKLGGILRALVLIPVLYYTYTGTLGVSADWFNITIFFLAALWTYRWETKAFLENRPCRIPARAAVGILLAIAAIFTAFTFFPPRIPFFRDPLTGSYGI
jgi:hypothetical protein